MTVAPARFSPSPSGGFLLQLEQTYPTDAADLWDAVTDIDRLGRWMARYEGDLLLGGTWRALSADGSLFTTGTVLACDEPNSFVTTWHAVDEDETTLTVSLTAVEGARASPFITTASALGTTGPAGRPTSSGSSSTCAEIFTQ